MDLSKLSDNDLIALRNKQYDKMTDEGLTYLHQQNNGTPVGSANAHSVTGDFQARAREMYPKLQPENQQGIWESTKQNLPVIGAAAATALAPEAGFLVSTALGSGGAAIGSAAKNLANTGNFEPGQIAKDTALYGVLPSVVGAGAGKIGDVLSSGADKAQQIAMGMKKFSPGVGTTAIEEGVRGTSDTMRDKIAGALDSNGSKIDALVGQLKGSVPSEAVANQVADYPINKFSSPSGMSTPAGQDLIRDAYDRASEISNRGEIAPTDARALAQTSEKAEGYSAQGTPKAAYQSQLARVEGKGYRDELRQMGDEQGVDISGGFNKLHQLLQGQKALNSPQTLDMNNPLIGLGKAALKATVASPPVMSYGAAGANMAGNAASGLDADSVRKLQILLSTQGKGQQQ